MAVLHTLKKFSFHVDYNPLHSSSESISFNILLVLITFYLPHFLLLPASLFIYLHLYESFFFNFSHSLPLSLSLLISLLSADPSHSLSFSPSPSFSAFRANLSSELLCSFPREPLSICSRVLTRRSTTASSCASSC